MKAKLLTSILLPVALLLGSITLAPAADRYHFSFSLSGKTTNDLGALVKQSVSKSSILRDVSQETAIPVADLALILERSSGKVLVVDRLAGTNVSVVIRLDTDLSVGNTNLTQEELFMDVDHPDENNIDGTAVARVTYKRNTLGQETGFKITGKIHVAIEERNGDPTQIYSGVFSTGAPFVPQ